MVKRTLKKYFLKVFSLHFVRLYKRKEELFLCRCTPNWVSRVYLSLSCFMEFFICFSVIFYVFDFFVI